MSDPPETSADSQLVSETWPQRMQSRLAETGELSAVMGELAEISSTLLGASVSCGTTLRYDGVRLVVGASDARAELLDETQSRMSHGPCLQSMQTGRTFELGDTRTETRWPEYVVRARDDGLRCALSLPLSIGHETFGALNVYGFDRPRTFEPDQVHQMQLFAAQTAVTLRIGTRQVTDARLLSQMEAALRSRAEIDQAIGIVMATRRCSAAEAFDLLRRESQRSQRRLRDIATELVVRTSRRQNLRLTGNSVLVSW